MEVITGFQRGLASFFSQDLGEGRGEGRGEGLGRRDRLQHQGERP